MTIWESWRPKRQLSQSRRQRWVINLGLAALNISVMRVSVGTAAWLASNSAEWLVQPVKADQESSTCFI